MMGELVVDKVKEKDERNREQLFWILPRSSSVPVFHRFMSRVKGKRLTDYLCRQQVLGP